MKEFIQAAIGIIGTEAVLQDEESLRPYECDGLSAYRQLPVCVLLPETVAQIQSLMRLSYKMKVPVIARGAGTGLSGGALPSEDAVILSLAKLNRILEIDADNALAVVQPGVTNLAVSQAVAEYGYFYAPDPSSQIACTIGGNVAENSGGVHCLKYGLTVHNVLAVTFITAQGELLELGSSAYENPGYDLLALAIGSEGMLGVVVEVTLKLTALPRHHQVMLAAFDSVQNAGDAVAAVIASGIIPAGLEMMDKLAIAAVEDFIHAGYPQDAEAILICELDGLEDDVKHDMNRITAIFQQHKTIQLKIAENPEQANLFWAGRKAAFPAVGRITSDYYCIDGTIPRRHLAKVLARINALSEEYGLPVANVFHAGDGNLHPLILYDIRNAGELERTEELGGKILEYCIEVGGTITGEHGVGIEKINQMCVQFASCELEQFHAIKFAFDEGGLLNPGKAVPSLKRCAEFGAMHVHHGDLKHAELERF